MDDFGVAPDDSHWEAGFEADRRVVVSRLGAYRRIFPRPERHAKRFYQRVYELAIDDWHIPLHPPVLGPLCLVEASVSIRFQPTLKFAREHLDAIDDLGGYIKTHYRALLQDAAEWELRALESAEWLETGLSRLERRVENTVHELLAIRAIQSRARCRIETRLESRAEPPDTALSEATAGAITLELLRRRREAAERLARENYEREIDAQRTRLEYEARLLELRKREAELRRLRQEQEVEQARTELSADEAREAARVESEIRLREERLRQEARLRRLELEASLTEKQLRAEALADVEQHLHREIELLAMERQRLALEEEIHDAKIARARGWIINARHRFPLGEDEARAEPHEAQISHEPNDR